MTGRIFSLVSIFLFLFLGCQSEPKETFDIVIQNGSIIALETGEVTKQDIFILEGRIKRMTDPQTEIDFEAKKTIDATGLFLLPGFWDNHVHFRGGDSLVAANKNFLKLYIANGITTVRDAGGDLTPSVMAWKDQIEKGELLGPTIFTSGPKIDGPGATWAGSLEVENASDISGALDSLQHIPVDFVKLYESRLSGQNYLLTLQEAEKRNLITSGHMPFSVTLNETITAGIDAVEHLYYIMKGCSADESAITKRIKTGEIGFWQAMPLLMNSYSDNTAQKTFTSLRQNNVFVVPTLHIGKVLSYLDEVDHTNDPYLKYMGNGIIKTYQGRIKSALNASAEARTDRKRLDTFFSDLAKSLNEAGVGLLAGSDSGAYNAYTYPGISLHREMHEMVDTKITPLETLRTSAYNGSKFLKKDSDYGTLAVGKISDIVLLEANPLIDIRNTKKIEGVIKGNTVLDKKEIKALLKSAIQN